jgi:branched-chain amino acid transport system ATP-binding protein
MVKLIFETLKSINAEGATILLVEQNVRKALELSTRAYVLENGRIALSGSRADLLQSEEIKQAYLGM